MHVILVKVGEIHLKGQNRPYFERRLMDNIRNALYGSEAQVSIAQSRIYVKNISDDFLGGIRSNILFRSGRKLRKALHATWLLIMVHKFIKI